MNFGHFYASCLAWFCNSHYIRSTLVHSSSNACAILSTSSSWSIPKIMYASPSWEYGVQTLRCGVPKNNTSQYLMRRMKTAGTPRPFLLTNLLARGNTKPAPITRSHGRHQIGLSNWTGCSNFVSGGIEQHTDCGSAEAEVVGSNPTKRTIFRHR